MEITLKIYEGEEVKEEKTFVQNLITGRKFRKTIEIQEKLEKEDLNTKSLDTIMDFIVEIFDNKFSRDDLYDGLDVSQIIPTYKYVAEEITKRMNKGSAAPPNR